MKSLLSFYMIWRWGIRGSLKPPLASVRYRVAPNGDSIKVIRTHARWYQWRLFCWRIENRLYHWTGLPKYWAEKYKG